MNRDIKFRCFWKGINKMKYFVMGDFMDTIKGYVMAFKQPNEEEQDSIYLGKSIVMEYTGIKDKNGKEIYEGDILQFSDKWEWYRCSFKGTKEEILTDHIKYPYERRVIEMPDCYNWLLMREIQSYWEVVGNIYENVELTPKDNAELLRD